MEQEKNYIGSRPRWGMNLLIFGKQENRDLKICYNKIFKTENSQFSQAWSVFFI